MSRTVIKPEPGFRAELPGLDLATLIQMTCARRERLVVRVSSYGEEGYLYSADGRLVHATVGSLVGDAAVLRMLAWPTGDFSICERPFPLHPTIETSTEGLLLRAAQAIDEAALDRETDSVLGQEVGLAEQLEGEEEIHFGEDEPTTSQPAFRPYAPLPPLNLPTLPGEIDVALASSVPPAPPKPSVPPPPPSSRAVSWPLAAQPPVELEARKPAAPQAWPITPVPPTPALASLLQARDDDGLPTFPTPAPRRDAMPPQPLAREATPPQPLAREATPARPPMPPRSLPTTSRGSAPRIEAPNATQGSAPRIEAPRANQGSAPRIEAVAPARADATSTHALPPRTSQPRLDATPARLSQPRADVTPARPSQPGRSSRPPAPDALPPVSLGRISEPPRRPSEPPPAGRTSVNLPRPVSSARPERLPPLPPAHARKPSVPADEAVLASVRIDARGEVVGTFGGDDQLAQLVAYVSRIATLVQTDFALDPFDALHAELAGKRVLIYQDSGELVGVVMKPSSAAQELRQRLGV